MIRNTAFFALFGLLGTAASAAELVELRVFPPQVSLTTNRDFQSVVVQAVYDDGLTRDVTSQSAWTLAKQDLVRREGNTLFPQADGETQLTIAFEGKSQQIPVQVAK